MTVIQTKNLKHDAQLVAKLNAPLVLIFSQEHCAFCVKLKEEIIAPMLLSGDYQDRVLFRELLIDDDSPVIDFDGSKTVAREVFVHYDLYATPSVLLLDSHGMEIAERQLGINSIDYYSYYLNEEIDRARQALANRSMTKANIPTRP